MPIAKACLTPLPSGPRRTPECRAAADTHAGKTLGNKKSLERPVSVDTHVLGYCSRGGCHNSYESTVEGGGIQKKMKKRWQVIALATPGKGVAGLHAGG